ncbi:YkgJ family cysteine cluster protein [Desulfocurvus sp. DL9XJH121]
MGDPHVCARCAESEGTCCRLEPGLEEMCFPLSEMERDRILRELAGDAGAFARQANTPGFVRNMHSLFPGEEADVDVLFPARGFHIRMATDETGRCRLLGPEGCVLSREARPYYCRLFPFWFQGGALYVFASESCRAQREAGARRRLLSLFDVTEKQLKDLYGRLRLAWGLSPTGR